MTMSCPEGVAQEHWRYLAEWVTSQAVAGFTSAGELREQVDDYFEDDEDHEAVSASDLDALVTQVVAGRRAEQAAWSEDSDSDRLDRAFAALERQGVLGRMNFTCCGTCGAAEIGDERDESRHWRGYTFFHQQDAERLGTDSETLYLSYGVFQPEDLPANLKKRELERLWLKDITELANEVVATLRAQGLDASWNQDTNRRIEVNISDWRRPVPEDA